MNIRFGITQRKQFRAAADFFFSPTADYPSITFFDLLLKPIISKIRRNVHHKFPKLKLHTECHQQPTIATYSIYNFNIISLKEENYFFHILKLKQTKGLRYLCTKKLV